MAFFLQKHSFKFARTVEHRQISLDVLMYPDLAFDIMEATVVRGKL
jgi:hypothetical protein